MFFFIHPFIQFTTLKYPQKWKCRNCSFYVKLTKGLTTNWLDKPGFRLDQKKSRKKTK